LRRCRVITARFFIGLGEMADNEWNSWMAD
jgi:hypothetical protein